MSKSMRTAVLWFVGALALLLAGVMTEPRRPFTVVAAVLFFVVGIATIWRGRR